MTNHLAIPNAPNRTPIPQIGRGFTVNSTGPLLRPIDPMVKRTNVNYRPPPIQGQLLK